MGRAGANLWVFPIFLPIFTFQPGKNHRDGSRARFALPVPPFYWWRSFGRVEMRRKTGKPRRSSAGESGGDIPEKQQNSQEKSTLPPPGPGSRLAFPPREISPCSSNTSRASRSSSANASPARSGTKINITSARAGAAHLHIPGLIIARQLRCFDNNQGLNMLNMLNSLNICPPVARNRRAGLQIFAPPFV